MVRSEGGWFWGSLIYRIDWKYEKGWFEYLVEWFDWILGEWSLKFK